MKRFALTCLVLLTAALSVGATDPAASGHGKGDKGEGENVTYTETLLSNERDTSRWAFVAERTRAFSEPRAAGRKVARLRTRTPEKTSELVLTLRERVYSDGAVWTEVRLPVRGADARGWVARSALGKYRVIHSRIEVDRSAHVARLYKNEQLQWSADVAVGDARHATPTGNFYIRDRLASANPRGRFGPYALGLSARAGAHGDWPGGNGIGIHGTNRPKSIPGDSNDACVRLKNDDVTALFKITPPGTPVRIF